MTTAFRESELCRATFLHFAEVYDQLDSTQDRAIQLCREKELNLPALVVAERQSKGRGRDGASWWSPPGALLFSLIVPLQQKLANPANSRILSLTAALAVADFLRKQLRPDGLDANVRTKWPNDVYVDHAKIAGLLIDVPHHSQAIRRRAIIGVGLNVNNQSSQRPQNVAVSTTSLRDLTGKKFDLQNTLIALVGHLERRLDLATAG